eukprot:gene7505-1343_t
MQHHTLDPRGKIVHDFMQLLHRDYRSLMHHLSSHPSSSIQLLAMISTMLVQARQHQPPAPEQNAVVQMVGTTAPSSLDPLCDDCLRFVFSWIDATELLIWDTGLVSKQFNYCVRPWVALFREDQRHKEQRLKELQDLRASAGPSPWGLSSEARKLEPSTAAFFGTCRHCE